jgi:hypothetical protein
MPKKNEDKENIILLPVVTPLSGPLVVIPGTVEGARGLDNRAPGPVASCTTVQDRD